MNWEFIWLIISAVLAVVGAIVLPLTFLSAKNEGKFKGFLGWMYDFLTFKKMMLEALLKGLYLVFVIFITLGSFAMLSQSFIPFIVTLVLGNISARIVYEFSLILLLICRNTTDISKKLSVNNPVVKKVEAKTETKAEEKVEA